LRRVSYGVSQWLANNCTRTCTHQSVHGWDLCSQCCMHTPPAIRATQSAMWCDLVVMFALMERVMANALLGDCNLAQPELRTNLPQVHATPYTLDTCIFNTYSSQKSKRHHTHTTHQPFPSIYYTTITLSMFGLNQCLNQQLLLLTLCCNFLGNTLSSTQCSHSIRHVSWLNYRGSF
jgi:hypothetical protein